MSATPDAQLQVLFPSLTPEQMDWTAQYGVEESVPVGHIFFRQDEPADTFYVLREGEITVKRSVAGGDVLLAVHTAGHFTGEISLMTMAPSIATGVATRPCRVIRIAADCLGQMLSSCPESAAVILFAIAQRRPEAMALSNQREKLAALGTMAAGLAHELNNPAAAAQRASQQLRADFDRQHSLSVALCRMNLQPPQRAALGEFQRCALTYLESPTELGALERSDREGELSDWLEDAGVSDAWTIASTFVSVGVTLESLQKLREALPDGVLNDIVHWLEATLSMANLTREIDHAATRISTLVKAVKSYTYMDQAPQQEVDVHAGLEDTLVILGHKIRKANVTVTTEFDRSVPCITAFGSELNQVWTNLIDNAIDAVSPSGGKINLRTWQERGNVLVEIADNGSGIPDDVKKHIFEPFFTTKGVGQGTGLGLDIAYRIVVQRHKGDIIVQSQPGETRFRVCLPGEPTLAA